MHRISHHLRSYRFEYFTFAIVAVLVSAIVYNLVKAKADYTPTWIRDVTYTGGAAATATPFFYGSTWGLTTDTSGNVYFTTNSTIFKVSPTGQVLLTIKSGTATSSFNNLTGIDVDSSGNIYVIDYGGDNLRGIKKFDSSGNLIQFVPAGWKNGITVTASGTMYMTGSVYEPIDVYDASGSSTQSLILSDRLGTWHPGIAHDSSGYIYVADYNNSKVKKFDQTGNVVLSFGGAGTSTGQFTNMAGIAVDSSGNIYAIDVVPTTNTSRLQKFDASGNFISSFLLHGSGYSIGMSVDPSNHIWVAEGNAVEEYDQSGNVLLSLVSGTGPVIDPVTDNHPFHPYSMAKDSHGNFFVVDDWYGGVFKFNANGDFITKFGSYGSNPDQFGWPNNIVIDKDDYVYVADCGQRVAKFSNDGTYISSFGSAGTGDGQFSCAQGLAMDAQGNFYVGDNKYSPMMGRIEKFDHNGNFIKAFGSYGTSTGQFDYWANGIAVDSLGNVYATDYGQSGNPRVEKFDSNGNFISQFGGYGTGNGQFVNPGGVAVDAQGNIYVGDWANHYVQKFDSNGNYLLTIKSANGIDFINPHDIYIDSDNHLNVLDYDAGRIAVMTIAAPPLLLTNVTATSSATSTSITWTSDDLGTTQVEFGPTTSYGSSTGILNTSPKVTSHAVTITNLVPCSLYNYRVKSANNSSTTTSSNYTFTTDSCTAMASTTAITATVASTTATSSVTLSTITVEVPPTFSTTTAATTTFQALKLDPVVFFSSTTPPAPTLKPATDDVFHLTALTDATTSLTSFTAPITVTIHYDRTQFKGVDESTLKIYRYDQGAWNVLSNCTRDPVAQTVTCETSHFSDFTLFGAPDTSSTSNNGSGFVISPDNHLSSTPPATVTPSQSSGSTTSSSTTPLPKPTRTPVKIVPKTTTVKPSASSTKVQVILPPKPTVTTSPVRFMGPPVQNPHATTTQVGPLEERRVERGPVVQVIQPKTFLQKVFDTFSSWWK